MGGNLNQYFWNDSDDRPVMNNNGDQFDLSGVFYTVALFFAGLGLVFKSRARWALFGLGGLVFAGTSVFMAMLPWAG